MAEETTIDQSSQASADLPATSDSDTQQSEELDPRVLASAPINVEVAEVTTTFDTWDLAPELLRSLGDMGYERPMPVQQEVFQALRAGKDLMVQSKTGSGKTAAFGIPIAQRLADGTKGVQSLILAPTRELAMQVAKEIEKITEHMDVTVVPVYGGAPINPQIQQLKDGVQIVAGTPGRVLDHIRRRTLDTSGIRMLVLDECDEMLSMGFQEEIENIISTLPAKEDRQTLLFSATIPKEIERIGRRHMRDPEMVSLSSDSVGADLIDHYYYVVSGMARTRDLLKVMKSERPESALIFCNTREETSTVARYLVRHGYDAEHLSSDLSQADRERVMGRMKAKNLSFLVATDIAARGIDISALSHVINYTFPGSPEVYVHRSGRTGRAGKQGTALSLVGPREIGAFYYLKLIYKIIPTERDIPTAEEMASIEEVEQYHNVIERVQGVPKSEYLSLAKRLWQSNDGERVVGMLLQELITNKTVAAPAQKAAAVEQKVAVAASEPEAAPDPNRKRRRRNRGTEDAPETATAEVTAATAAPATAPAAAPAAAPSATPEGSAEELSSDEQPKRKRRRRRGAKESQEEGAQVEAAAPAASVEAAAPAASAEAATPAASAAAATPEASAKAEPKESSKPSQEGLKVKNESDPDTVDAEPESLKAESEVSEEKPQRKRRRRGAKAESEDEGTSESSSDTKPQATKTSATDSAKAKAKKRRAPKSNNAPGAHGEFWEAWAESKDSDTTPPADGETDEDTGEEPTVEAKADESEAPKKKRRSRRRRGKRDEERDEEEENDSEESPDSVRVFVNVGRREDADVEEIRAFLVEALGETEEELGKITLRNTHCYVRVPEAIVDTFIEACTGLVFHDREMVVERAKR